MTDILPFPENPSPKHPSILNSPKAGVYASRREINRKPVKNAVPKIRKKVRKNKPLDGEVKRNRDFSASSVNRRETFIRQMAVQLTRYLQHQLHPGEAPPPQAAQHLRQHIPNKEFRKHVDNVAALIEGPANQYATDVAEFLFSQMVQSGQLSCSENGYCSPIPLSHAQRLDWFIDCLEEWNAPFVI